MSCCDSDEFDDNKSQDGDSKELQESIETEKMEKLLFKPKPSV